MAILHSFNRIRLKASSLVKVSRFSVLCAVALALIEQRPASAVVISVPGYGNYDIQVQEVNFSSLNPPAPQMPWWGNQSLANLFATTLGSSLGPVFQNVGPFFAWDFDPNSNDVAMDAFCIGSPCFGFVGTGDLAYSFPLNGGQLDPPVDPVFDGVPFPWAVATQVPGDVPGPLPILGTAFAFGFSRKLRMRIKSSRTEVPSTLHI
ncbi:hypothetical protein [Cyanobium sp. AMD-g]|uniref:hypothetical protein n=1 Tax=Cyanobium sp. AMD-g TaxID=2823699 RepID=UPI0020CF4575|nr:hypothetical protein [Cyanobium sp. AMD-g]